MMSCCGRHHDDLHGLRADMITSDVVAQLACFPTSLLFCAAGLFLLHLQSWLRQFKASGRVITADDIKGFFTSLQEGRRVRPRADDDE